jgi:hypothetical protein
MTQSASLTKLYERMQENYFHGTSDSPHGYST